MKADLKRRWSRFLALAAEDEDFGEAEAAHLVNAIVDGEEPPELGDRTSKGWLAQALDDVGLG